MEDEVGPTNVTPSYPETSLVGLHSQASIMAKGYSTGHHKCKRIYSPLGANSKEIRTSVITIFTPTRSIIVVPDSGWLLENNLP